MPKQPFQDFQKLLKEILQSAEYNLDSFVTDEIFDTENLEIDDKKIREFFGLISKIVLEDTSLQLFGKIKIQTRALYCIIKAINKTIRKEMSLYLPLIIHEKFCLGQTEILF